MATYRFFDERCRSWNLGMFDGASAAEALALSEQRADARRADSVYTVESAQRDLDAGVVRAVEVPVWHVGPTGETTVPPGRE